MMKKLLTTHQKQRGAALITALSILLVLTILGVATISTTVLQERMAGNMRDYEIAFEQAESGLRAAETYLNGLSNANDFSATGGTGGNKFNKDFVGQAWKDETKWSTASANSYQVIYQEVNTVLESDATQSLESTNYTNTEASVSGNVKVFQITVRGYGQSVNSRVMLQGYYGSNIN